MFLKKWKIEIYAPVSGKLISIEKVNDPVFSSKMLGDGFAIIPSDSQKTTFVSPIKGTLTTVMDTGHAYGITEETTKVECLVHIGLDTVELKGKGFEIKIKETEKIKAKDELVSVDLEVLKVNEKDSTTPIVFTKETMEGHYKINILKEGQEVTQGEVVAELIKL